MTAAHTDPSTHPSSDNSSNTSSNTSSDNSSNNNPHNRTTPSGGGLRKLKDLPGPRGLPLLGNTLQIRSGQIHLQLEAWRREFGPYFQLRIGRHRVLVVADHRAIAGILRDRPDGFERTARLRLVGLEMGMKPGVFGANGPEWLRQRRMVMSGFDPTHVRRYFPSLIQVARRLTRRWEIAADGQRAIDLQSDLMRFTVDTIAGLAFGAEVNTLESGDDVIQQHLDKIFPALFRRITAPFPVWRYFPSKADRELKHSMVQVNLAVTGFIRDTRTRLSAQPALSEHPSNLLEAMIAAADREGSGIDDDQVAGNVLTMLLAGEDTTANTIAWMIHLLWKNPAVMDQAVGEIRANVSDCNQPSLDEVSRLVFLEACIHETMRLKPVAPQLPLQTRQTTRVGDIEVPAGTVVINLLRSDGMREDLVPDATQFKPQRWLEEPNTAKRISMPFGAGPRICPGRYLAMLEMKIAMTVLLGQFELLQVSTANGDDPEELLSFTMMPVGLEMRLRRLDPGAGYSRSHSRTH